MARLILVRHGETEWNRLLKYQGHKDIELNKRGLWQASQTAGRLAPERVDAIYSSDLKRAVKTAEIIAAKHNLVGAIRESPLLREMNFGDFEGLTFEEIDQRYQKVILDSMSWKHRGPDMRPPNGESLSDVTARVDRFIEHLNPHNIEKTVLIVAHGGSLQLLICRLLGIGTEHWWQFRLAGAAVSIVETYHEGASLILLNGVGHLTRESEISPS